MTVGSGARKKLLKTKTSSTNALFTFEEELLPLTSHSSYTPVSYSTPPNKLHLILLSLFYLFLVLSKFSFSVQTKHFVLRHNVLLKCYTYKHICTWYWCWRAGARCKTKTSLVNTYSVPIGPVQITTSNHCHCCKHKVRSILPYWMQTTDLRNRSRRGRSFS